jgi:SAM-dependent methyltransferase
VERFDKGSNRAFYDSERENDRRRFRTEPSKLHTAALLVPWVTSNLRPDDRVLDIAGGSGSYASEIVRATPVAVVGVDISESMVRQRGEDPLLAENVVGDMEALPFADEMFDAAMFVAALHHVPDPLPALREALRVLRPGGQLFAFEPCSLRAGRGGPRTVEGKPHEFAISSSWLLRQIRAAGFVVEGFQGRSLVIRALAPFVRSPSLRLYLAADRVDSVVGLLPFVARLGTIAMVQARKPGQSEPAPFRRSASQ